ncbi:hypothetical protein [Photobacterium sanguinicancri]|uniref:hypothetical protein n=1 Tax=Photobacterium sanguinicancri TaxID=875932 RepID=UPI003D0CB1F0
MARRLPTQSHRSPVLNRHGRSHPTTRSTLHRVQRGGEGNQQAPRPRKCPCCKEGRIEWTTETRFALFCQKLSITYSRFERYSTVLEKLVEWLVGQRTAAMLAMKGQA